MMSNDNGNTKFKYMALNLLQLWNPISSWYQHPVCIWIMVSDNEAFAFTPGINKHSHYLNLCLR